MPLEDAGSARHAGSISMQDERALVDALVRQDREATAAFLSHTHRAVFALACRITLDTERRRDWSHSALIGLLDDIRGGGFVFRHPGGFWSWFRKRAYFRLLDEYRRDRTIAQREIVPSESGASPDLDAFGTPGALDEELERIDLRRAIDDCFARIASPDQRRALGLRLFDDLEYQDIALALGTPLNTVRAWIRRGRIALRQCLVARWGLGTAEDEI